MVCSASGQIYICIWYIQEESFCVPIHCTHVCIRNLNTRPCKAKIEPIPSLLPLAWLGLFRSGSDAALLGRGRVLSCMRYQLDLQGGGLFARSLLCHESARPDHQVRQHALVPRPRYTLTGGSILLCRRQFGLGCIVGEMSRRQPPLFAGRNEMHRSTNANMFECALTGIRCAGGRRG
jgi:hypothetical protein